MDRLPNRSWRYHAIAWICILTAATRALACDSPTATALASGGEIKAFFDAQGKQVVTFVGYSGAGYEHPPALLEQAAEVLSWFDPSRTIVNIGAIPDGIGAVYDLAKRAGFVTTGIVSTEHPDTTLPTG